MLETCLAIIFDSIHASHLTLFVELPLKIPKKSLMSERRTPSRQSNCVTFTEEAKAHQRETYRRFFLPSANIQQLIKSRSRPDEGWEKERRTGDTKINYIDSYDYKVVVNIKIILQSFKEKEKKSEKLHKHNRPNYVIDYKWSKLHLRVFYSHYVSLLAVGEKEATIGLLISLRFSTVWW